MRGGGGAITLGRTGRLVGNAAGIGGGSGGGTGFKSKGGTYRDAIGSFGGGGVG